MSSCGYMTDPLAEKETGGEVATEGKHVESLPVPWYKVDEKTGEDATGAAN